MMPCRHCTHPAICESHGCGNELIAAPKSADEVAAAFVAGMPQLAAAAVGALAAWDSTVLPQAHDGMLQERMECLRAALADLGPNVGVEPTKEAARS